MRERLPLRYVFWRHVITFSVSGSMIENLLNVTSTQKQETDVSTVSKDSDAESENLSSLIPLSVSDSQKTDKSNDVSFIGIHSTTKNNQQSPLGAIMKIRIKK